MTDQYNVTLGIIGKPTFTNLSVIVKSRKFQWLCRYFYLFQTTLNNCDAFDNQSHDDLAYIYAKRMRIGMHLGEW